jgi:antitoxin ParD1/3/4
MLLLLCNTWNQKRGRIKIPLEYLKWQHTHAIGINQWVYIYIKSTPMVRQSISLTTPNDEWLKSQVDKEEYSSKSELVNDLIRQARRQQAKVDWLKTKLEKAEQGGFTTDSKEQILQQAKSASNG